MSSRVLSIGQCGFDHGAIRHQLQTWFNAEVIPAHDRSSALAAALEGPWALILVNRVLDADGSPGLEIIHALKADPRTASIPVMLVTNYPEHQQQAALAGAALGFGKATLSDAETRARLAAFLA